MNTITANNTNTTGSIQPIDYAYQKDWFVRILNDNKIDEYFLNDKNNCFNEDRKITSLYLIEREAKKGNLKIDLDYFKKKIDTLIASSDGKLTLTAALQRAMDDHCIEIKNHNVRYILNSPYPTESTQVIYDVETKTYFKGILDDVMIRYSYRAKECKELTEFSTFLESPKHMWYALNEFRHNRKVGIQILCGDGGSGKSIWASFYSGYKKYRHCVGFFRGDNNTGNFGKTCLIVEEESDTQKAKGLTLNVIKDMVGGKSAKKMHYFRKLYNNASAAYGFVVLIFTSNRNRLSKINNELNKKGEDASSIRRRTSTFNFTKELSEWMSKPYRDTTMGGYIAHLNDVIVEANGDTWTLLDAHLNWLEETGYFNDPIFQTGKEYIVVHSPHIGICTEHSNDMNVLLESVYEYFLDDKKTSWEIKKDEVECQNDPIMMALRNVSKSKIVGTKRVKEHFAAINNSGLFEWKRNRKKKWILTISDMAVLESLYDSATGYDEKNTMEGEIQD